MNDAAEASGNRWIRMYAKNAYECAATEGKLRFNKELVMSDMLMVTMTQYDTYVMCEKDRRVGGERICYNEREWTNCGYKYDAICDE